MKKLLIASTALVATAGMASADITMTGSANAGIHSGLDTAGSSTAIVADGIYSNAGVKFALSGATDNGITFSTSVDVMAGNKVDQGDFEYDGEDDGAMDMGAISMAGSFGTLTFSDGGIENLYSDALQNADISYATSVGAVSLTVAHDTSANATGANSVSAGYSASGMDFTLSASEVTTTAGVSVGTSTKLTVAYALNDTISLTGKSDQAAGAESVQTIGASTTLNGLSVSVESANNSTWDVDLGYSAGAFALAFGTDETSVWAASASTDLGGGASFKAGINAEDSMYAGLSFAF